MDKKTGIQKAQSRALESLDYILVAIPGTRFC